MTQAEDHLDELPLPQGIGVEIVEVGRTAAVAASEAVNRLPGDRTGHPRNAAFQVVRRVDRVGFHRKLTRGIVTLDSLTESGICSL